MTRLLTERLRLSATFEALTPIHVGGMAGDPEVDLTVTLDGAFRPVIPGTSLAGVLRSACAQATDPGRIAAVEQVWGGTPEDRSDDTAASFVTVDDAVLQLSGPLERRDGIGIDRFTATAAEHVKYVREVVPRGSSFEVRVTVDVPADDPLAQEARHVSAVLAGILSGGRTITIGASGTRGLGRIRAVPDSFRARRLSFHSREATLAALRAGADVTDELRRRAVAANPDEITITVHWSPDGPLMVKAGLDGLAVDALPLTGVVERDPSQGTGHLALVLPGSSVKGALRSHAELIVRTLAGLDLPAPGADGGRPSTRRFLDQLADPGLELVQWLFGVAATPNDTSPGAESQRAESRDTDDNDNEDRDRAIKPGRGALSVADCASLDRFPAAVWDAVIGATKSEGDANAALRAALRQEGLPHLQQAFHVAVDRWTGGAANGLLFSVLEPHAVRWEPLELRVDLRRLPEAVRDAALCLLLLVLRELARGEIPLGHGANRGMGAVRVKGVELEVPDTVAVLESGSLDDAIACAREHLLSSWQAAISRSAATKEDSARA